MKKLNFLNRYFKSYKSYKNDLNFCKNLEIKIFNFWNMQSPKDLWFYDFFKQRNIIPKGKELSIYSVFGDRLKIKFDRKRPKIFFTGENIIYHPCFSDLCLNEVDISLGFDYIEDDRYLRFPLWYLYFIEPSFRIDNIKNWINKIENSFKMIDFENRRFCSLVARHDPSGTRKLIFDIISSFGNVECGGDFLNNTDLLKIKFNDDKIRFLSQFKFNICFENSDKYGYVTEKIFHAIVAGCIPIYWGSNLSVEADILNQNRILFFDPTRPNILQNSIISLESNKELLKFMSQPVFKPNAAKIINERLDILESRIKKLYK